MEERILKAMEKINKPAETWQITDYLKIYCNTMKVHRGLKKLEKKDKVARHESSRCNSIVWVLK